MESRLIEALADCVELMASGESLAGCLRRYPAERAELEPLLRASATLRGLPVPPPLDLAKVGQVALARAAELRAVSTSPEAASASSTTQKPPDRMLPALLVALLIALMVGVVVLMVAIIALIVGPPQPVIPATATPTQAPLSTDTPMMTPSVTSTLTPTHTVIVTPSPAGVTATPGVTVAPAVIVPPLATVPPPPPPGDDDDGDGNDDAAIAPLPPPGDDDDADDDG